jgi:putative FmdB family regulatory protein
MPLYEFDCDNCKRQFDIFLKIKDYDKPQICELCDGSLTRLVSKPKVKVFKAQHVHIVDKNDKPTYVRNNSELKDAINRYNDSDLAISGKIAIGE